MMFFSLALQMITGNADASVRTITTLSMKLSLHNATYKNIRYSPL